MGAVLAGGAGSRLGGRKEESLLAGKELIRYPIETLERAGIEHAVVAKPGFRAEIGCDLVLEPERPLHPLAGIVAALEWAQDRAVLVVACDMPFLTPGLLAWIAACPGPVTVPRVNGRLEPLIGRYESSTLPALRAGLETESPVREVVGSLGPTVLEESLLARFGDPRQLVRSINTAEDLESAAGLRRR